MDWKDHLTLWVIVAFLSAGILASAHHMGAVSQKAEDDKIIDGYKVNVRTCEGANQSNQTAISGLKTSLATCEAGRVADKAANDTALALQKASSEVSDRQYQTAVLKLNKLLQTPTCRQWAAMPACTVDSSSPSTGAKK